MSDFEIPSGGGAGGGQVNAVVGGTGIDVDATDPVNPIVDLDAASIASLALADTSFQKATIVSGSLTAANDTYYNNVASATYTDPSPAEGEGFIVFVRNGTATVGGTGYGTAGTIIHRIYHSGAWANYVYNVGSTYATAAQGALADSASQPGHTHLLASGATDVTASAAEVNILDGATLTTTELNYVDGVTSAIQTQLNAKLAIADIDDTPVNGETSAPISSNWAFDHAATAASDTAAGHVELATAAETTTGTDATRAITPDGLAGSEPGKRTIAILVSGSASGDTALATGDGLVAIPVDTTINGMNLVAVKAYVTTVSSSGAPLFQVRRSRRSSATARTIVDMLSTGVSIDANEFESADAATAAVINTSNDDVQTGDIILIDCDTAGTGTKGAQILLTFQLP